MGDVPIREYIERLLREADLRYQQRFDAQQEGLLQALNNSKEAVLKAETAMEKRFDNTNEWRRTYDDLANNKVGREEYMNAHKVLEEKITGLAKRVDTDQGRDSGIGSSVATVVSLASVALTLILVIWTVLHR